MPQKFIERICTDLDKQFQQEINKVIFSYVDSTEKGDAKSLEELIDFKSHPFNSKINSIQSEITEVNKVIISVERKLTSQYKKSVEENLNKYQDLLERHLKNKPAEVVKPESTLSVEDKMSLEICEEKIKELEDSIDVHKDELLKVNSDIDILQNSVSDINALESEVKQVNSRLKQVKESFFSNDTEFYIQYTTPKEKIITKIEESKKRKNELQLLLDNLEDPNELSLYKKLDKEKNTKKGIIAKSDAKEKAYQKYIDDIKEWELRKAKILGSETSDESLHYYKSELERINKTYPSEYITLKENRDSKIKELFEEKVKISNVYSKIYEPIDKELQLILEHMDEKVEFSVNIVQSDNELASNILAYVNHSFSGIFSGRDNAFVKMNEYIKETNFSDLDSLLDFIKKVLTVVTENLDKSSDIIKDKEGFYKELCCLDFIGVEFNLAYAGRELLELSPGERGIVLLIFYLALNKGEEPLIIDQPEDNLDNESVFNKLVPCIVEAKKRRQVIIVTHNPNIAVACDAEQVIHCKIDKSKNEITYTAGSIEDKFIRDRIVDVLEGTEPAFSLRRKKYLFE
ncbi:hypothetical protein J2S74_001496 [Evansella vedderi]|uniref:ATPase AAA-type core domain-containing protein n=1 Tax=Evansella vedderi TaxID=38282 RepID=A0ABT9ZUJ1_9BACI|nr:hypothetical protein [Evansella vedderi]MDQ0254123.1 hypothetical protein [Evansella vedderi]